MEESQKYYLPNAIIHDDVFKISIFRIFDKFCPPNKKELEDYLNVAGYFGRYKILQLVKKGRKVEEYKIEIYLPNSKVLYNWPILTPFRFDNLESVYKVHKKIPQFLPEVLIAGSRIDRISLYNIVSYGVPGSGKDILKSIDMLHKIGLFVNNKSIIKNLNDIMEISKNISNYKPY